MRRVGVRELRQQASKVLDEVKAGAVVEVTERGEPVARIVPLRPDPWQALLESGRVQVPIGPADLLNVEPFLGPGSASDALDELRRDER